MIRPNERDVYKRQGLAAVAKTYQMMLQLFGLVRNQKSLDDPVSGIRQQRYCSWAAFVNPQTVRTLIAQGDDRCGEGPFR